jgi:HK97 family phage major capsid protein
MGKDDKTPPEEDRKDEKQIVPRLSEEQLEDLIENKKPSELSTSELLSATSAVVIPEVRKAIEGIIGDKLEKATENIANEYARREEQTRPARMGWATENLITRSKTGIVYSQPEAIKVLNFEDYTKTAHAIIQGAEGVDASTATEVGDLLQKERKFYEDNDLLDIPCGRGMAILGLTPRMILDYRKKHFGDKVTIGSRPVILPVNREKRTTTIGSAPGSYLAWVQYISQMIDAIVDADEFYAKATHIPIEATTIKLPRAYRNALSGGRRSLVSNVGIKSEGTAPTEGGIKLDNIQFDLTTQAGWIAVSDELRGEAFVSVQNHIVKILTQSLIESIGYFAMQGSGSSQPLGLFNTKVGSAGTTACLSQPGNHDSQWDDVRAAGRKLGGDYFAWMRGAAIVCGKGAYHDFYTRKDAFNNYIMRGSDTIDTYPAIRHTDAPANKAALTPPATYYFVENFAETVTALGLKEGKTLWTEGEMLYYVGTRLDSRHIHHKILSDNPDDAAIVFITGLQS